MPTRPQALLRAWPLALLLAVAACGSGGGPTVPDAGVTDAAGLDATDGPLQLQHQADPSTRLTLDDDGGLLLVRGDLTLLRLPAAAFELGTVDALDDTANYDPSYLEAPDSALYTPPASLIWRRPEAASGHLEGAALVIDLRYPDGRTARVTATAPAPGRFTLRWVPAADAGPAPFLRIAARADATEGFYGLGELFDHVEHRGRVRPMHFLAAPGLESGYNEAHVPIPFLIGTRGWGLFVETYRPGVFAVATDADDLVRATFGVGEAWAEGLTFHLFAADHPLDVTRLYFEVTGFPGPVAPWALGPLLWRDEVAGQAAVLEDFEAIASHDLATTGYWIDRPYASGVNSFDFAPASYPDPAAMIQAAHAQGLRVALWHTPYVDPNDEATRPLYDEAVAQGYFAPEAGTDVIRWGPPIDFSNPAAMAWWRGLLGAYAALGVEGYKLDYAEEITPGLFGVRLPWRFHDGSDELTMHRRYQLLYHETYRALLPDAGGLLLCRAASWGDQVHGLVIWPGDIDADMSRHGETVVEDDGGSYVAVGGLPAAIVAGSTLGPSGFPLFGSDTGGYRHAPPSKETFRRWFEHTALSPVMQVGTNSNDLPWEFGADRELDPALLADYRRYARLHLRLWPYLWTYVQRNRVDGRPIQRPLGLAFPDWGQHPDFSYLLGDDLLVVPRVRDDLTTPPPLPDEVTGWVSFWDGASDYAALSPDRPIFRMRPWAPIPLLRPTIDTLNPVADPEAVDSYATTPGPLWARVAVRPNVSGAAGAFELFDGTTLFVQEASAHGPCAQVTLRRAPGAIFSEGLVWDLVGADGAAITAVASATDDAPLPALGDDADWRDADVGWRVTSAPTGAQIKLGAGDGPVRVEICPAQ